MAKNILRFIETGLAALLVTSGISVAIAANPKPAISSPELRCAGIPREQWSNDMLAERLGVSVERVENVKRLRDLTIEEICTMPSDKLARAFLKAEQPKPDSPGEWAAFRAMQQSVNGVVKPDGLFQGYIQRQAMVQAQGARATAVAPVAGISSGQWTSIGPGNIGGRIRAIAINPNTPSTLLIGGVAGGIWKSTNSGASWSPVNDFMGNLAISSLVYDPTNSNIVYAGTGEGFFNADAIRGFGIFKSTDAGLTWNLMSSTNPTTAGSDWYYVNRIAVRGNLILAATRGGVYRSIDGGASWVKTYTPTYLGALDLKIDPNNSNNAIVGDRQGVVAYTANGGQSWITATLGSVSGFSGRVELTYARSAPGTVYASEDINSGAVYKSTDGGATWSLVSTPAHLGNQGWYDNAIWVDPTNANHIIVGGLDLKRSTDGGLSFTKISTWYYAPTSPHADHHAIVSDPNYDGLSNRRIYFGNDGGIYSAADITTVNSNASSNGWTNLNNGLAITQFYSGSGTASAGMRLIGGTQDNGSLVYTGTSNWSTFFGGDGGYSASDSLDGNYFYGEYVYLAIHRATNGLSGSPSSSTICSGIGDGNGSYCSGGTGSANFIAPFKLDPNDNNRMLAGGASLWVSTNVKAPTPTWAAIKPSTGSYIHSIAVANGNSDIIWVGHNDGSVYKTSNGTAATPVWVQVRGTYSGRNVLRIVIDKDNSSIVYVTYGGYAGSNVFRTSDGGSTWTDISGALPQVPVRGFARFPGNANWLYAGTEVGVFASTDAGATWSAINDGPANVSVDELFWFDSSTLVAATHGRGMFLTTVSNTSTTYSLSVSKSGSGTVSSNPAGINCGGTCSANFNSGTSVTLTAAPDPGYTFSSWGGACTGSASTCMVSMTAARSVVASFTTTASTRSISVTKTGSGTINSSPAGIACGTSCSGATANFSTASDVYFTATPDSGYTFAGWSGACVGTGTCMVAAGTGSASLGATFTATGGGALATPTYRFNNPYSGGHFFTSNESEKAYVLANLPAYHLEGVGFYTYPTQAANSLPIYRFSYSAGFHYFTISETEKSQLLTDPNYKYDGIAFYGFNTPVTGTVPVYRFRNSIQGSSFYTANEDEFNYVMLNLPTYVYQSIVFYVRTAP